MENPKIKAKPQKVGNSYFFRIPKALVDCEVLNKEKEYLVEIIPATLNSLHAYA